MFWLDGEMVRQVKHRRFQKNMRRNDNENVVNDDDDNLVLSAEVQAKKTILGPA